MKIALNIRLFQRSVHAWLALYMLAMLFTCEAAWTNAPVQLFRPDHGVFRFSSRTDLNLLSPVALIACCVAVLLLALLQIRRHRWWLGLMIWFLFRMITHRTWLASNGGVQLMENMLIWCAIMGNGVNSAISTTAFWIARFQLLMAYAAAAAHKFTGSAWLDGSAVMMVARDPGFHLHWLAGSPWLCTSLTYAALGFMVLFPFAVWWRSSQRVFLAIGMLFHLSTALFMGIPQMGLAFIACYTLWADEEDLRAILRKAHGLLTFRSVPQPRRIPG